MRVRTFVVHAWSCRGNQSTQRMNEKSEVKKTKIMEGSKSKFRSSSSTYCSFCIVLLPGEAITQQVDLDERSDV